MAWFRKPREYHDSHAIITGGSTGIGFALAKELLILGSSVTIVARTQSKLDSAKEELQRLISSKSLPGRVLMVAADVADFHQVKDAVRKAEEALGNIDLGIACAGLSLPGRFLEQDIGIFEKTMNVDYYGTLYLAKAVLPGFVGYSTYCPAKYAVRGLADVLRNELVATNVKISVGYPVDTDTPGFANEQLTKLAWRSLQHSEVRLRGAGVYHPDETEAISRFAGGAVLPPEKVAQNLIRGLQKEQYQIKTPEFVLNLLLSSVSGINPRPFPLVCEFLLAPMIVIATSIYGRILDNFVRKYSKRGSKSQ